MKQEHPEQITEAVGMPLSDLAAVLTRYIERASGELLRSSLSLADSIRRAVASTDPWRVPADARRVRPVGSRSKSRSWLARDHDRWRPCERGYGGYWWWTA